MQSFAVPNFDISTNCLDLSKMFNSQNLWFFCLYCPLRSYPNKLTYPSFGDTTEYNDAWLETTKVTANQLATIEDLIQKQLLRRVYRLAYSNYVDELDSSVDVSVEENGFPHWIEFNYPRFPFMNRYSTFFHKKNKKKPKSQCEIIFD